MLMTDSEVVSSLRLWSGFLIKHTVDQGRGKRQPPIFQVKRLKHQVIKNDENSVVHLASES